MASNTTNGETKDLRDNVYVQQKNLSSDSNANPNSTSANVKNTGAVPKLKSTPANIPNGMPPKSNNNVNDNTPPKSEVNGTSYQYVSFYMSNKTDAAKEKGCKTFKNGFSQLHKGTLALTKQHCTNSSASSSTESPSDLLNGIEYGPSTSHAYRNTRSASPQRRDSDSESCSDTGNDDLSCSDEGCIYTYKGDAADLPRSFMNLDGQENSEPPDQSRAGSRGSSPEMDFLEMDFDPGPSCDADSDVSSVHSEMKSDENLPENETVAEMSSVPEIRPEVEIPSSSVVVVVVKFAPEEPNERDELGEEARTAESSKRDAVPQKETKSSAQASYNLLDEPWIPRLCSQRTLGAHTLRETKGYHSSSGDLFSSNESTISSTSSCINISSSMCHSALEKQLVLDKQPAAHEEHILSVERAMVWTEQEAAAKQITQIGTSACGATAVLNVLSALGYQLPSHEKLLEAVPTRPRANSSPLVQYLRSRGAAGSTHKDIIRGLSTLSGGQVYAKFFHMYPERYINLSLWLTYWIKKGAVPIATLNLQRGIKSGNPIPDAWHHQMIFGVGPHGIYLTNPLERMEEGVLWHQLSSESVLLVRREDITCRWNNKTDLRELLTIRDVKWHTLNVLGQVANILREHQRMVGPHAVSRTHVRIPASYSAGITLAINLSNPACELLKHCPELPVANTSP